MNLEFKIYHTEKIADAIQRKEQTYRLIGVNDSYKYLALPNPQVVGTMVQRRTYAMDKAMELIEATTDK
tara:strand:+ start:6550 stop:6756 length:207 start_codon:yes stop_codon:yes gene_type:complete